MPSTAQHAQAVNPGHSLRQAGGIKNLKSNPETATLGPLELGRPAKLAAVGGPDQ